MPRTAPPTVAVTLGDPAGIGPEVALEAVLGALRARARGAKGESTRFPRVALVGDLGVARAAVERLGRRVELMACAPAALDGAFAALEHALGVGAGGRLGLPVVPPAPGDDGAPLRPVEARLGRPTIAGARLAYGSIRAAAALALSGRVDAVCTAPVSKEWLARAGVASTGHTEILAALARSRRVRLMMALGSLRVVLATNHLALRDVPGALDAGLVRDTIEIAALHLARWWGIERPRIAVAALNPHASDGGVYGDEEARVIAPAIRRARAAGIDAIGPVPADALFSELGPRADAIVAMYHDQGLIPIKQAGVHRAVNVTLGLPFVRTSPDHGTAFDLAGTGRADPRSMRAALDLACELVARSRRAAALRQAAAPPRRQGARG